MGCSFIHSFYRDLKLVEGASEKQRGERTLRVKKSKVATDMGRLGLLACGLVILFAGPLLCTAQVIEES